MKAKTLISAIAFMIAFYSYGQISNKNISLDSTKIEVIGNSVYRIHNEFYNENGSGWIGADSSSIRLVKIDIANVLFKQSKPEMLSESIFNLNNLSTLLIENPKVKVQVNGFADKIGNGKSNLKLSIVRARMIKLYLIEKGINPNRITTNGFGDNYLICKSPCEKNQRAEFVLSVN